MKELQIQRRVEMDIYKAFGIYKGLGDWEDEETYPHGMNKEQFNKLKEHFDTHMEGNTKYLIEQQPDFLLSDTYRNFDRAKAFSNWVNDYGHAYAQGKYGRNLDDGYGSFQGPNVVNYGDPDYKPNPNARTMEERFENIRPIDEEDNA